MPSWSERETGAETGSGMAATALAADVRSGVIIEMANAAAQAAALGIRRAHT